jgi:hypothetical protein
MAAGEGGKLVRERVSKKRGWRFMYSVNCVVSYGIPEGHVHQSHCSSSNR